MLELLKWKAPAALMLLVVLMAMNTKIPQCMDVQFVELFAGDSQVSLALWASGLKGSSHDLRFSNLMDLCTPHGFVLLGYISR